MKKVFIYINYIFLFSACSFDIIGKSDPSSYIRNQKGEIVFDCKGKSLGKDSAHFYWDYHNLPRGTTEFVCVDGKAYLPGKALKQ